MAAVAVITEDSIKQFLIFMFYFSVTELRLCAFLQCYHFLMKYAGFVLAGGKSSRMGSDKALLPFQGRALVEHIAAQVLQAAGNVTLVGDPARYSYFGYPVIKDKYPGRGPLSGIHAALTESRAGWNLIVACDMPEITSEFLATLLERAERGTARAVIPAGPSGRPEPLCAAYHSRAAHAIQAALDRDIRKVMDGLAGLEIDLWQLGDSRYFHNLNTPGEWNNYRND
jgi:molybdopterin-guanine dinucleotide biosynthesis protein A